jgi:DNA-directed RNA polymerase subunit RPC12/RpoP
MSLHLHLDGLPQQAVTRGLVALLEQIKKARKSDRALGLTVKPHDELEAAAKDVLDQMGWEPPAKKGKGSVEVVRDPRQVGLQLETKPGPRAEIACANCSRKFKVPVGDHERKCPDCGSVFRVKADEDGKVIQQRAVAVPPDEILQLIIREKSDDLAPLTKLEAKRLEKWRKENPDHTTTPELIEAGDRIADPKVVGSGNPLAIDCHSLTGKECKGFEATDTAGTAVCPTCGQKYTIEIVTRDPDGFQFAQPRLFNPETDA